MERSLTKSLMIVIISALSIITLQAQEKVNMHKVFSDSYIFESQYNYAKAIETVKKVYADDSYEINLRLGWLYYNAGLYKESADYYNKAIQILPLSVEARLGYALPLYALGNKELVIEKYKEILSIDSYNYYGNYRLGLIYYEIEDFENAHKHLEKLINLYPFDYNILIISAWTYYRLGQLREAKILFNKALLYSPDDQSAKEGLGLIK